MKKFFSKPELLAPAGSLEKFRTALLYGADAVYMGGKGNNLRAGGASGFSMEELKIATVEADKAGVRCYYCLNSFPRNERLSALPAVIEEAAAAGVHGFIIADPGMFRLAKKYAPQVPVHLSTQANTTNAEAIAFWAEQGVTRVNLARELTCEDIVSIQESLRELCPQVELEVFVHGSMCLSLSGQCLMSAWLNNRPANEGLCTQPCRFAYRGMGTEEQSEENPGCSPKTLLVEEATRPGELSWVITHGEEFSEIWAPDDLCLMSYLPWFCRSGIDAVKIEGRSKSPVYLAHVVDAYATALASIKNTRADDVNSQAFDPQKYMPELLNSSTRALTSGFFIQDERRNFSSEALTSLLKKAEMPLTRPILARVAGPLGDKPGVWRLDVRGQWRDDADVELMLPGMRRPVIKAKMYTLENHRKEKATVVNSGVKAILYCEEPAIQPGIFIRSAV